MRAKTIICTAGDDNYFRISLGLLGSIRDRQQSDVDIGYLDVGLGEGNRATLDTFGATVAEPGWAIPFENDVAKTKTPGDAFKAMIARPFLRDYFPGYETYIWIDADAWVQNWWAIDWLIEGARGGALNIVPELDRTYSHSFDFQAYVQWNLQEQGKYFGMKRARKIAWNPVLNSGVLSAPAGHAVWAAWQENMREALSRDLCFFVDQLSLNCTIYTSDFSRNYLPSQFNWLANMACPAFDPETGDFVEPGIPYRPIGILHLTGKTKMERQKVTVLGAAEPEEMWLAYDPNRRADRA